MNRDSKKVAITGVSRGLGRAMVHGMIELGHTVAGCARSESAISRLRKEFPGSHRFDVVDVCDHDAVESWAANVLRQMGAPDLLVNNAATINANAVLWEVPVDEFSDVIDVNIKGMFHCIRAFVPKMIQSGSGVVVNFSSGWGRSTSAEVAPYCATKWAVEGLTQSLAQELPDSVAAVALNPGIIDTDMLQSCFGESAASYQTPHQWAQKAVPFLLGLGPKDNAQQLTV